MKKKEKKERITKVKKMKKIKKKRKLKKMKRNLKKKNQRKKMNQKKKKSQRKKKSQKKKVNQKKKKSQRKKKSKKKKKNKKKEEEPKKGEEPKKEGEPKKEEEPKKEGEPKKEEEPKKEGEPKKEEEPKKEDEVKKEGEAKKEDESKKEEKLQEPAEKEDEEKDDEKENSKKEEKEEDDDSEKEHEIKSTTVYDNVDYLLNFLKSPEEAKSNYVLVGYFYKILNHLFTSQSTKIVKYLFDYPKKKDFDVLDSLIKNMNRKCMGEIIKKLLLFNEENYGDFVKQKMELLFRVLEELKTTKDEQKYECICSTLESAFYNKAFVIEFMKDEKLIANLYNILDESKEQPKKSIAIMKLLIKINENILKNIDGRCTTPLEQENPMDIIYMFSNNYVSPEDLTKDPEANMEELTKNLIVNSFNCFEKNKFSFIEDLDSYSEKDNSEFNTTYQKPQKKMGMKKLAQIELFRTILDILVNAYAKCDMNEETLKIIEIIKERKIFPKIHKLFFDFPFNNLYQAIYIQIMDIILNEFSPELLIKTVFDDKDEKGKNIIEKFIGNSIDNIKFSFISNRTAFHPNFSIEVSLLSKIFLSTNEFLINLIKENKNLEAYHKVLGEEVKKIFEQKLLLIENEVNIGGPEDDANKSLTYFGKKNFMELLEEDIDIYKKFLKGEDYQKYLDEKKERERIEQEEKKKEELEIDRKLNDDEYFNEIENEEEANNEKNEAKEDNDEEDNEKNKNEEEKGKEESEKNTSEESEKDKIYNDVNFWKAEIVPNDEIMSAVLNDLD